MFRALLLEEESGKVTSSITSIDEERLPEGDVTIRVEYSTLNYKDGMILNGLGRLVRSYPHVPGVDFAGSVEASDHSAFKPGDKVIMTGFRVGEMRWGGFAEKARVKGDWLVPLPKGLSTKEAMAIGTAGFTAMLAVMALEEHGLKPESGEVLVTGAAGGVGSVAASILAGRGYQVAGSTGRPQEADYLRSLGVQTIVPRAELAEPPSKPLDKERWVGGIDSVGGTTLAHLLTQICYGGSVASVGLAGGNRLETTVIPFLLRGVNILGIDSVMCPLDRRKLAWDRLAAELPKEKLSSLILDACLDDLPKLASEILKGQIRGRVVVDLSR